MPLTAVDPRVVKSYTFDEIAEKITKRNESKVDVITTLDDVEIMSEGGVRDGKSGQVFQFTDRSLAQLSALLGKGVSTKYWKKFPVTGPVNWVDQVAYLKDRAVREEGNKEIILRGIQNGNLKLRAIVSSAYARIDDGDILPVLERAFNDTTIYNYRIDNDSTFIEGFIGEPFDMGRNDANEEDIHYYAQCYSNSEVGGGPLTSYSGVFRMWCANLCRDILGYGAYSRRHIARNRNMMDISEEVADNIRYASFRIREQRDEVVDALKRTKSHLYSDSLTAVREMKKIVRDGGFAEPVVKACSDAWQREPGNSAFHLLQAMTAGAKSVKGDWSYADRCRMEKHAGSYVASLN